MSTVDKAKLRAVYLRKRKMLSSDQCAFLSQQITNRLITFLGMQRFKMVHVFLPILKHNEINTWPIVQYLKERGTTVVVSKSNVESNELTHFIFEHESQLENNKWGIPEPTFGQEVLSGELDIILIPMVTFDRRGHRIGYGKGYYDKFLSDCRDTCIKVGLSMSPPLDVISCTDPFDIALDYCVTPLKTYSFGHE
ncbi:5-formyltetrahydrofolate cyclo-ligase [Reichenbachiella agarivorans]|uniref:5-formyltetrahydrofolate cyclo-ligase n=1 Tax=Reichenbachiella agarivorans TaxID=2979464 RepID=A0ABY6CRM4_9BACT|nr:5-formyltetrahydrofolate cyclo-ligase [Reichenbachiella agarivorans]UXP33151.1 5-formyltetrahydrofolate cyclo-ligase [Reichenbachiella agarivorans]